MKCQTTRFPEFYQAEEFCRRLKEHPEFFGRVSEPFQLGDDCYFFVVFLPLCPRWESLLAKIYWDVVT